MNIFDNIYYKQNILQNNINISINNQNTNQNDISHQKVGEEIMYQKVDQEILSHQKVNQKILSHQKVDQEILSHQKVNQKILSHQKVNEEILSHQTVNEEIMSHQTVNEEIMSHQTVNEEIMNEKVDEEIMNEKVDEEIMNEKVDEEIMNEKVGEQYRFQYEMGLNNILLKSNINDIICEENIDIFNPNDDREWMIDNCNIGKKDNEWLELDNFAETNSDIDEIIYNNNDKNIFFSEEEIENDNEEDAWDAAINDNHFIINNKIIRIFPILKNTNNYSKLLIDEESFSYITIREVAELTSKIICHHLIKYNINPQKIKLTDYTSGVGGNVLSFSKYFSHILAIEIDKTRAEYLENNINVYNLKNITVINDSAINYHENRLLEDNPNVIFIDPPWGGNDYKNNDILKIKLGDFYIEELVMDIFKKFSNNHKINSSDNYSNKFVVLKLPKNFDIENFYFFLKNNNDINFYIISSYLYILNKMLLLVCEFNKIY